MKISQSPFTFPSPIQRSLVLAFLVLMGGLCDSQAGFQPLPEEVPAYTFYIEVQDEWRPVIGVKSVDRVRVLMENGKTKLVSPDYILHTKKPLPPVGRVTHLGSRGNFSSATFARLGVDYVWNEFDLIANRDMEQVYAVLFMFPDGKKADATIGFAPLGNLPAGKAVTRKALFSNVHLKSDVNWKYRYDLYANGLPVEMIPVESVYNLPESKSLLIPWKVRLEKHLEISREHKLTRSVQPFEISLAEFSRKAGQASGLEKIRPRIRVKKDGTVALVNPGSDLSESLVNALEKDVATWQIFPALEDGVPIEKTVTCPIQVPVP